MNDVTTKTHSVAAAVAGLALLVSAIAPGHDVALVIFVAALPLLASLAAIALQRGQWSADLLAVLIVEIAVVIFVPRLYLHARTQSDAARVVDLAEQSRIGESRKLVHQALALSPNATWRGQPLRLAAENLNRAVSQIEARVGVPLPRSALLAEHLGRARDLAMLGRTSEALRELDAVPEVDRLPDAMNLRGAIHETRGEWRAAGERYARAKEDWLTREESQERTAGLMKAITGIAFCERKLGRLREAEAAWQERLKLFPTAESHFLLAQFYEDTQQAPKARFHAQEAVRLDPKHHTQQGRQLMDKLVTSHFGCLGVFRAESSPSTPFGAATIESK